ncbi:hypothetical protein GCM10009865_31360 [Aeromicrobium ponti]|uniref:Uncharacterized protein n=1 Tax=Cytobacillus oceanisediminis TaxID=665099 RepID=A0A562JRK1_9BACI|nr:hypothetical protein [Cytobacillus oceanisediminis]TWH85633.1 hypothetical protein IQ19_03055 [Cytobacillus oceanisediminis]
MDLTVLIGIWLGAARARRACGILAAAIAIAIDSLLAVALAVTLTPAGWFSIGGIDGGYFFSNRKLGLQGQL